MDGTEGTARDVVVGEDGLARCWWCVGEPEYQRYHDEEWGRPEHDERRMFEKLCLEGFQAGLSWLTILRKRSGFRHAFAGFDSDRLARFDDADVERLLGDAEIVRNRAKIEATIGNARALEKMHAEGASLAELAWSFEPTAHVPPRTVADLPAFTPESEALSRALKRRGFRYVGPTTCYAFLQSMGIVNDHLIDCWTRQQ